MSLLSPRFGTRPSPVICVAIAILCGVRSVSSQRVNEQTPMVSDWSHQHVIFSQPGGDEERAQLRFEPRYWMQLRSRGGRWGGNQPSIGERARDRDQ
jgi:hypothetical protein